LTILAFAQVDRGMQPAPVVGERLTVEGDNVAAMVLRTGRAARIDSPSNATGSIAERAAGLGLTSLAAVPIIVGGRIWGLIGVASPDLLPADTEKRMGDFADLVATAIANAATRDELIASRARIVAAADDARRRIERDLHDGAQQRLVSLGLQLRLAESSVPPELQSLKELMSGVVSGLTAVSSDLQEISRGIHPAILSEGGLAPALKTLARRCPVPADIDVLVEQRLPDSVEVSAYYVVAEALTNAAKYAQASKVNVCAEVKDGDLRVSIQDDGIGGADSRKGSGLIGLKDRVEVLGGHMKVISPPGSGTSLQVTIPLPAE
jgi:signal transduction histidine kinase